MSGLAALAPPPLPNAKATQPEPPLLPNETLVAIFGELGLADLLTLRRASRKFKALAEFLLADLLQKVIAEQRRAKNLADAALRESEREKRPRMQHYRTFLQPLTCQEINELRFMRDPPHEVRIVCVCLSLLHRVPGKDEAAVEKATEWSYVKKVMASRVFRAWLVNLEPGVDSVPLANVRLVEKIIMNDPHISYQNVRRVNLPAYKLLIVVAAVIQIVIIQDELTQKSRSVRRAEGKLSRSRYLLRAVGGPRKPSPEDFDEELEETKEPPSRADTDVTAVDAEGDGPIVLTEEDFADDASVFDDDQDGIGIPNTEDIDMDEDLDEDFEEMATA